jgi:hypothetical protein
MRPDPKTSAAKWYSRIALQEAAVRHLDVNGWSIRWVADPTRPRPLIAFEPDGPSSYHVDAERHGTQLLVHVVEYPDPDLWPEIYRRHYGELEGGPGLDPRALGTYSSALFTAVSLRDEHPDVRIAQLYPLIGFFRTLEDPNDRSSDPTASTATRASTSVTGESSSGC